MFGDKPMDQGDFELRMDGLGATRHGFDFGLPNSVAGGVYLAIGVTDTDVIKISQCQMADS